jgi:hypothetical protein
VFHSGTISSLLASWYDTQLKTFDHELAFNPFGIQNCRVESNNTTARGRLMVNDYAWDLSKAFSQYSREPTAILFNLVQSSLNLDPWRLEWQRLAPAD